MNNNKCLTEPTAMNEKPPRCFLGCCDVRSWTLFVSFLNIVSMVTQIINVFKTNESLLMAFYSAILYVGMVILNIELGRGVFRRNITPVQNWLQIYTISIILTNVLLTVSLIVAVNDDDPFNSTGKEVKENLSSIILSIISFEVIFIMIHYPVYQYYKFQKAYSRQTFTPKKGQTI